MISSYHSNGEMNNKLISNFKWLVEKILETVKLVNQTEILIG